MAEAAGHRPPVLGQAAPPGWSPPAPLTFTAALPDGTTRTVQHIPYLATVKGDRMALIQFTCTKGPAAVLSCHYCINQSAGAGRGGKGA